jgi:hypothetical protein
MALPLRIEFSGTVYHVTSRGNARQKIYRNDEDREAFLTTTGPGGGALRLDLPCLLLDGRNR